MNEGHSVPLIFTFVVDADRVDNTTINVEILNGTSDIRITWMNPLDPNGLVVAYKVKVINTAKQSVSLLFPSLATYFFYLTDDSG